MKATAPPSEWGRRLRLQAALAAAGLLHAAGALPAPGPALSQPEDRPMIFLQEQDNGQTVTIHVNDELKIVLPENATTGYRWVPERVDAAFVDTVAAEPRYAGDAVGSGGTVAFMFRARKAGTSHLSLKQWRHWEGDASVIARFAITLRILPSTAKLLGQQ